MCVYIYIEREREPGASFRGDAAGFRDNTFGPSLFQFACYLLSKCCVYISI